MEVSRSEIMIRYVENYYQESKFYTAQNNAKGEEFDLIHSIIEDMPNQFHPQTATWGLSLWEEMLGIEREVENIVERRNRIMIKLLTQRKLTPIFLERLIKNVVGANINILRNIEPYTFEVCVKDDSLDYDNALIWRIIEEYKEAHMAYNQAFNVKAVLNINYIYSITFTTVFYPQFNLPERFLNGSWELDGNQTLGGYDGDERIDLYPVKIEFQTEAMSVLQEKPEILFLMEAKEKITNKQEIEFQTSAVQHGTTMEKITMQTESEVKTGTGEIFMDNQNFLDGEWELDGSRTLNGGDYQW